MACKEANHDEIKLAAREKHQQCRLIDNNFFALLSETDDVDATLLMMLEWAYDEDFHDVAGQMISELKRAEDLAIKPLVNHPISSAIR